MENKKKQAHYERLILQLKGLMEKTSDPTARMATVNALLHHKMKNFFWTGFYRIIGADLIVGPYQGPLACQVLDRDQGVCRAAIHSGKTVIVPDVNHFEGHIACDSRSKSEIAVPVFLNGEVVAVLDIDSREYENFDKVDAMYLEQIAALVYD
jgi:L-methionine (R)-S-oxide reductase